MSLTGSEMSTRRLLAKTTLMICVGGRSFQELPKSHDEIIGAHWQQDGVGR